MCETVSESFIRQKLEDSGELGKIRAMVVDAALKSLSKEQKLAETMFLPSPSLKTAKDTTYGRQALSIVMDYLENLGLNYTLSVLKQEASLNEGFQEQKQAIFGALKLPSTNGPILPFLIQKLESNDFTSLNSPVAPVCEDGGMKKLTTNNSVTATATSPQFVNAHKSADSGEDTTYFISKWIDRVFYRCGAQVNGQQVQLEYLTNCTVYVLDPLDSITVDDCEGGELVVAACEGTVFLRNCKNMIVHVACKQLRTRDCEHIKLHVFASTDPVIESSHHMIFKPFHIRLPGLKQSFKAARLDPKANRFVHIYDFTEDDVSLPQPHFNLVYPDHGLSIVDRCKEKGTPECPSEIEDFLAGKIAPASSSEAGQNKSYNIKTGAHKWTGATTMKSGNVDDLGYSSESLPSLPKVSSDTHVVNALETNSTIGNTRISQLLAARGEASEESYSSFNDDDDENDDDDDSLEIDEDSDDF